jgi:hypothetical protein
MNPMITGTNIHQYTHSLKEIQLQQAIPRLYRGTFALHVTLGRDSTLKDYVSEQAS